MRYVISLALSMLFVFSGSANIATVVFDPACTPQWDHVEDEFPEICGSGGIIVKNSLWHIVWPDSYFVVAYPKASVDAFRVDSAGPPFTHRRAMQTVIGSR